MRMYKVTFKFDNGWHVASLYSCAEGRYVNLEQDYVPEEIKGKLDHLSLDGQDKTAEVGPFQVLALSDIFDPETLAKSHSAELVRLQPQELFTWRTDRLKQTVSSGCPGHVVRIESDAGVWTLVNVGHRRHRVYRGDPPFRLFTSRNPDDLVVCMAGFFQAAYDAYEHTTKTTAKSAVPKKASHVPFLALHDNVVLDYTLRTGTWNLDTGCNSDIHLNGCSVAFDRAPWIRELFRGLKVEKSSMDTVRRRADVWRTSSGGLVDISMNCVETAPRFDTWKVKVRSALGRRMLLDSLPGAARIVEGITYAGTLWEHDKGTTIVRRDGTVVSAVFVLSTGGIKRIRLVDEDQDCKLVPPEREWEAVETFNDTLQPRPYGSSTRFGLRDLVWDDQPAIGLFREDREWARFRADDAGHALSKIALAAASALYEGNL